MRKLMSLIKACMTDNMSLFKIRKKDKTKNNGKNITIMLSLFFAFSVWSYANMFMDALIEKHNEPVLLMLFTAITAILILVEGIYKSGNLLFDCKDDNLLLALPVKKTTIVFIRLLKFYVFEVLYSALFMVPTLVAYATRTQVQSTFYLIAVLSVFILPIIPVIISSVVGAFISATSAKFKQKNLAQVVISMIVLLGVLYASFNLQGLLNQLGENANVIGDAIAKFYYPAVMFSKLATEFNIQDLLIWLGINIGASVVTIFIMSKIYFKINSSLKINKKSKGNSSYKIKVNKPFVALVKKELKKVGNTPVLITNAVFGMVLFLVVCFFVVFKIDSFQMDEQFISKAQIISNMSLILYGLISFGSFTSSVTSSMISLEGKRFPLLKSMPVSPYKVIMSKVATAMFIIIPFVIIGDVIFCVKFRFGILEMMMIIVASILLPAITEIFGILVNLKYPNMSADTDAEAVKQSSSSNICAIIGLLMTFITISAAIGLAVSGIGVVTGLVILNVVYGLVLLILLKRVKGSGVKRFSQID